MASAGRKVPGSRHQASHSPSSSAESVTGIAELGVVFLLFLIGLELSLPRLSAMRRLVIGLGGSQVILTSALIAGAALSGQQPTKDPNGPYLLPQANRLPDINDQMKMRERQEKQQSFDAANAERKKQLSDESAQLLTLAMSLKAEVDKTNKDMLSLNVIRKADEIERLAHNVKEKMKLTVGGT